MKPLNKCNKQVMTRLFGSVIDRRLHADYYEDKKVWNTAGKYTILIKDNNLHNVDYISNCFV